MIELEQIVVDELQENITKLKTFINDERTKKNCYTGTGIRYMFLLSRKQKCDQDIVNAKETLNEAKAALKLLTHIDDIRDIVSLTDIDSEWLVSNCQRLNKKIEKILDPEIVSGVNPAIGTPYDQRRGGKQSRRYKKSSKKTMRRRRRTYRKK